MDIERTLGQMSVNRKLERMDEDNPVCPGCGRRERELRYAIPIFENNVCAECADEFFEPVKNASELAEVDPLHKPVKGSWLDTRYERVRD